MPEQEGQRGRLPPCPNVRGARVPFLLNCVLKNDITESFRINSYYKCITSTVPLTFSPHSASLQYFLKFCSTFVSFVKFCNSFTPYGRLFCLKLNARGRGIKMNKFIYSGLATRVVPALTREDSVARRCPITRPFVFDAPLKMLSS